VAWTVGEAASLAKVSVRTLHHYDEIGLLSPTARTEAGYRLYESGDLERLQQIMLFRELGFSLDDIHAIMLDPAFDRESALRAQRSLLAEKMRRTEAMLTALDAALAATQKGVTMTKEEMAEMFGELFDGFDPAEYEEEVEQRWGETDAYKQSAERTKRYTKADWEQIKLEGDANTAQFVAAMDAGLPSDSPEALEAAAEHHKQLEKWFYDAPLEMYGNLSDMWVNDPRFKKNIDKKRDGLAEYQRDAVKAWVASQPS
jgi:MerR family transcriptional regulator, thiopeptide resistance regulator